MGFGSSARQEVYAKIVSRNGIEVGFERVDGGLLSIGVGSTAFEDTQGFYIVLASTATEGLLMVKPWQSDYYKLMPFFKGENKLLITGVKYDAANTATTVYWIK
jgi:hypothetical protein